MNYLSTSRRGPGEGASRLAPMICTLRLTVMVCAFLVAGMASCKGPGPGTATGDTTGHHSMVDTVWINETDTTSNQDWNVYSYQPTKFQPAKGAQPPYDDFVLDGEVFLVLRHGKRPFIIRTRQLIITVESPTARLHIDAFASSPGEQADLLEGQLKVTKSYHSSTDNEPETLHSGDMVMINRDIDLMEKETLDPAERKAVDEKLARVAGQAHRK